MVVETLPQNPEITTEEVTETVDTVEYETVEQETDELPLGESRVAQEGQDGYTEVTYLVTYHDGEEYDREETDRNVVDPVNEIIEVGTYEEPDEGDGETETQALSDMTIAQLKEELDMLGIEYTSKDKKTDLIAKLEG